MSGPRLACAVRYELFVACEDEDLGADESDYVTSVAGTVVTYIGSDGDELGPYPDEDGAAEREVDSLVAYIVQTRRAIDDRFSLFDVCDAHSDGLADMFVAVFDIESEMPREELGIEPLWEGLMYLEAVTVDPAYRGRGVAVQAVKTTIETFCHGGIVTAHPASMPLTDADWKALDSVKIAGSEVIVRDGASFSPYRTGHGAEPLG
ncbi:GNAT family N-acetyltransferase [Alienimonas sp. DA493]|uniref:GNAT family N-acetyltransferase n=1 Tax=Alienimonas sp. DA493 TaxID=3373605 RepID=UPI0037551788